MWDYIASMILKAYEALFEKTLNITWFSQQLLLTLQQQSIKYEEKVSTLLKTSS